MSYLIAILFLMFNSAAYAKDPDIERMISTYQANQARFHMNHRGKTLSGEGTVTGIKTDPLGTGFSFYIYLEVNGSKVNCDTENQKVAASLDKGQRVKFSGRVHDVVFSALSVRNCSFNRATYNSLNAPKEDVLANVAEHIRRNPSPRLSDKEVKAEVKAARAEHLRRLETRISRHIVAKISKLEDFPWGSNFLGKGDFNGDGVEDYLFRSHAGMLPSIPIQVVMSDKKGDYRVISFAASFAIEDPKITPVKKGGGVHQIEVGDERYIFSSGEFKLR